jgi:nucleoside-diphosphate-sugar epimerase
VEEVILAIMQSAGIEKPYKDKNITRKNEIWDVYVSIEKICKALNWQPHTSFNDGINQCVKYSER